MQLRYNNLTKYPSVAVPILSLIGSISACRCARSTWGWIRSHGVSQRFTDLSSKGSPRRASLLVLPYLISLFRSPGRGTRFPQKFVDYWELTLIGFVRSSNNKIRGPNLTHFRRFHV